MIFTFNFDAKRLIFTWFYVKFIRYCSSLFIILVTPAMLSSKSLVLVCDGLDTVTNIYVNDQLVGNSDNMFVRYVYNIKHVAKVTQGFCRREVGMTS